MHDVRHQLSIARRWLPLIVVLTIVAGAAAYLVAAGQPRVYEATARLVVEAGPDPGLDDLMVAEELAGQYARLADTRDFEAAVAGSPAIDLSAGELDEQVDVSSEPGSSIVLIAARHGEPESAAAIAAATANELVSRAEATRENPVRGVVDGYLETISAEIERVQAQLDALLAAGPAAPTPVPGQVAGLEDRLATLRANFADLLPLSSTFSRNQLVAFEDPVVPDDPVEPRPVFWGLLAAAVGLMLALAVAFIVEYLRDSVGGVEDLEESTGLPALGVVEERRGTIGKGEAPRAVVIRDPGSPLAGAYRTLRSSIDALGGHVRSVLVAGSTPADGKSSTAVNLAAAYAEAGREVLLVDADLSQPRLHAYLEVPNERGLTTLIAYPNLPVGNVVLPTRQARLRVLTAGPTSGSAATPTPAWIRDLMPRLLAESDLVIFDSPSLPAQAGAAAFGQHVQAAILVVEKGTRRSVLRRAAEALHMGRVPVVGVVLHRAVRGRHVTAGTRPEGHFEGPPGRPGPVVDGSSTPVARMRMEPRAGGPHGPEEPRGDVAPRGPSVSHP